MYKYTYRLLGSENVKEYENIKITETKKTIVIEGESKEVIDEVGIKAGPFTSRSQKRIDNFFVKVEDENKNTIVILIHIHDSLSSIWTSPEKMSLRKGMKVKFGLLGNFTDENYADFSFYPDLIITKINNDASVKLVNGRLELNTPPSAYPHPISNVVEIALPRYLRNSDAAISVKGSIDVLKENGDLKLVAGDASNLSSKMNILILSDGFDGSPTIPATPLTPAITGADQIVFDRYVGEIHSHMLQSNSISPWNLIAASNKINLWSYYTQDMSGIGTNEGEYIIVNENGNNYVRDIYVQIEISDRYYPSRNLTLASGREVTTIIVSYLCSLVGLPSTADLTKSLTNKADVWKALGWHFISEDTTGTKRLKFPGDADIVTGDKYLTPEVFAEWLKLGKRIHLEKSDTTYGMANKYTVRSLNSFKPRFELIFSKFKFKVWEDYGKFINNVKSSTCPTLGTIFYDQEGNGVVKDSRGQILEKDIVGTMNIKEKSYNILKVHQANNVIVLSRNFLSGYGGYNQSRPTLLDQGIGDNIIHYLYYVRKSLICLDHNSGVRTNLFFTKIEKKYYFQKINFLPYLHYNVRSTVFHELSHNYLLDEYNNGNVDLVSKKIKDQQEETEDTKFSNLQTRYDLQDPKPDSPDMWGNLKVDNIKWRWPRIKKIGIGLTINGTVGNILSCTIQKPEEALKFEINTIVLIRKGSLFSKNYIRCRIDKIDNMAGNKQFITLTALEDFVIDKSYLNNYFIIEPYWIDVDETNYLELIHPTVKKWINDNRRALVESSKFQEPQIIIPDETSNLFQRFDKMKIVGLFAGGTNSEAFEKGMYHPTGFCIMRNPTPSVIINDGTEDREVISNSFCQVCQYILIDFIDPTLHPTIDIPYGNSSSYPPIE